MPQPLSLTAEPDLEQAVNEALDALRIASSHAIVTWLETHRPHLYRKEAAAALERTVCQIRNERAVDRR